MADVLPSLPSEMANSSVWRGRHVVVLSPTPTHPQDYGNRKRVHAVCSRLQAEGALVHFVHYACEVEWGHRYPVVAQRAMVAAWESYTQVVPTRPVHMPPARGPDHEPDEWWDPAIGDTLGWLFARVQADLFLINYAWLAKAFEHAPPGALRVLDTHDRFSGRRKLLETGGISREAFHLNEAGEARALARAHLVWAIKEEEAVFFRTLVDRAVITVPHADPWHPLAAASPDPGVGLRLGFIGALNSLNLRNIRGFLDVALPIFRAQLAPLRLCVAGSVCEALTDLRPDPFVELVGRVEDVDAFYRSLDVVVVPMAFSTGLKIKVAEAVALRMPVLAHAHAFEGYHAHHPAQTLPSFPALAQACVDLARDPAALVELREASAATQRTTEAAVAAGFTATADELAHHRPGILLLPGAGPMAAAWLAANRPFYEAYGEVRVAGEDELAGGDAAELQARVDAAELVVVGDLPAPLAATVDWRRVDVHLVAALAGFDRPPGTLERLAERLRAARCLLLLAAERVTLAQAGAARHARLVVPSTLFGDQAQGSLQPVAPESGRPGLLVLATLDQRHRGRRLLAAVRRAFPRIGSCLVCPFPAGEGELDPEAALAWLLGRARSRRLVAVDLAPEALRHAALREALRRQGRLVVPLPATAGAAPMATLVHLIRARPDVPRPAYGRGSRDWLARHLARRKRARFAADDASRELTPPTPARNL